MSKQIWNKVISNYLKAGGVPIPINDSLIQIFQTIMTEEQAEFLRIFRKHSLNIDQIRAKSDLDEDTLNKMLNKLMDDGLILGIPSRSTGIMVYYLASIIPGLLEYPFMKGEKGEKQRKLAKLMNNVFNDLSALTQSNYEVVMKQLRNDNPIDRVVPVGKDVEVTQEKVVPYEDVIKIINKHDIISVNYCYCRNWKENLNDPCKIDKVKLNCFQFGRWGKFIIDHNFGKAISKEEAIKKLKEAEDIGLVHKAIHMQDPDLEEVGLCNCCSCCCQFFQLYKRGILAFHTLTSYIANLDETTCKGCGVCVEKCPIEAIEIVDNLSITNMDRCIGCGICAHHCPENARTLVRTGLRKVFIPPPKIAEGNLKLIQT
jgi:ferredoxin/predicted transcriptional regulator